MSATDPRIARAARNNAEWCDAVTRAWAQPCRFEPEVWINRGEAPPFYPNAVMLAPTERVPAAIAEARGTFAVKDSFASLDLAPLGFTVLFEAMWIWRDPRAMAKADGASWRIIREAESLLRWEEAWRGDEPALDLFRPALLQQHEHAFLVGEAGWRIVAGCVASRSAAVVGISNLFGAEDHGAGCLAAVQEFAPGLPVLGYEHGIALALMKSLGFQEFGPLRVWLRETD
jgi:hypothetical protein